MILIDTNVLLRSEQAQSQDYATAHQALARLFANKQGVLFPQVLTEYWCVCTRPPGKDNGFGWTCAATEERIEAWKQAYRLLRDQPEIYEQWQSLVSRYEVKGKKVHDARLVATLLVHSLTHILTFNVRDFRRFQEITVVHPNAIEELVS